MERQPVHTVYGGAHLFGADSARKLGNIALRTLEQHAGSSAELATVLGLPATLAPAVYRGVCTKLEQEPVEDMRIDFEDGYGNRPDHEEDGHAISCAREVARGALGNTLPPYVGIRIKPLSDALQARGFRTLELFLTTLFEAVDASFAKRFFITLPKLTSAREPAALSDRLAQLERKLQLPSHSFRFEIMVETPQSLFAADGAAALPRMIEAGDGRISAAHFGTYDFTAACGITAAYQHMHHPVCDVARALMQSCLAQHQVWLSDGATALLPVGDQPAVRAAWLRHYQDVRRSLMLGFYQGWDLHPAQLVTRYAAVYAFFMEAYDAAAARLRNFMDHAAQATLLGSSFDDAATGQGLLNYFLRGINAGAFTEAEVSSSTGLALEELRMRSFVRILEGRTNRASSR